MIASMRIHRARFDRHKHLARAGLFHLLYWAYLFSVATGLDPFPSDIDAYAIRYEQGSRLTQFVFVGMLSISIFLASTNVQQSIVRGRQFSPILAPIIVITLVFFISSVNSSAPSLSIKKLGFFIVSNLILIITFTQAFDGKTILKSTAFFLVAIIVTSYVGVIALPNRAIHQDFLYVGAWRGIFSHKNYAGAVCTVAIFVFMAYGKNGLRLFWIFAGLLAFLFLVMSQSKTALAGLIISPIIGWFLTGTASRTHTVRLLQHIMSWALVLMAALFFVFAGPVFESLSVESTLTGRLPLWEILKRLTGDAPLLGHGYESYFNRGTESALFTEGTSRFIQVAAHAHNGYFNAYIYGGMLALCCAVWLLVVALRHAILSNVSVEPRVFWLSCIIVFAVIRNIVEVDIFTGSRITWSITLMAAVLLLKPVVRTDRRLEIA